MPPLPSHRPGALPRQVATDGCGTQAMVHSRAAVVRQSRRLARLHQAWHVFRRYLPRGSPDSAVGPGLLHFPGRRERPASNSQRPPAGQAAPPCPPFRRPGPAPHVPRRRKTRPRRHSRAGRDRAGAGEGHHRERILGHDDQAAAGKPGLDISGGAWFRLERRDPTGDTLVVDAGDRRRIVSCRESRAYPHRCIPTMDNAANPLIPASPAKTTG